MQPPAHEPVPPVLARRQMAANRYFTTIEEDLPDRQGRDYTYNFIECRHDAVLVVPILDDGRLVVERIYRHPIHAWCWEFPAGGIEPGESPVAAAGRELEEETGWRAGQLDLLGTFDVMPGLMRMRLSIVRATALVHGAGQRHESMEHISVALMTLDEARAAATQTPTSSFLSLGLLHLGIRPGL